MAAERRRAGEVPLSGLTSLVTPSRVDVPTVDERSQPEPYWNGTSNIGKKSAVVARDSSWNGRASSPSGCTTRVVLKLVVWRNARFASKSAFASR